MQQINRSEPRGPASAYQTFQIISPQSTHTRPASCKEVGCEAWERGWVTRVPAGSDLADFIASGAHGRHFTETTGLGQTEREFLFPPGQSCFRAAEHRVSLERPAFYRVRVGDWREHRGLIREHTRPEHWVEDFALHQDKIAKVVNRG